jgi:hypothetical protein
MDGCGGVTYSGRGAGVASVALAIAIAGCATPRGAEVRLPAVQNAGYKGFHRVLVAGFVARGIHDVDVNQETALLLRMRLRSGAAMGVIETAPFDLGNRVGVSHMPARSSGETSRACTDARTEIEPECHPVFGERDVWRRIGEEYGEPLIVTGVVVFQAVAPRSHERAIGRRTARVWLPGFRLRFHLIVISGRTGEIIDSVALRPVTAHAASPREGALTLYFRLMDRMAPSILATLEQGDRVRILLR